MPSHTGAEAEGRDGSHTRWRSSCNSRSRHAASMLKRHSLERMAALERSSEERDSRSSTRRSPVEGEKARTRTVNRRQGLRRKEKPRQVACHALQGTARRPGRHRGICIRRQAFWGLDPDWDQVHVRFRGVRRRGRSGTDTRRRVR